MLDLARERGGVAIWKGQAAGTDRFRQAAAGGTENDATGADPLEGDNPKGFIVARRHDDNFMLPQNRRQIGAAFYARESNLLAHAKPGRRLLRRGYSGPAPTIVRLG